MNYLILICVICVATKPLCNMIKAAFLIYQERQFQKKLIKWKNLK